MNLVANKIHFVIAYLCQRAGGTQAIFLCKWMNSEIFIHDGLTFGHYSCNFTQVFIPYWNFEYTKSVTPHCNKSGRWYGPRSCNSGDPSWVKWTSNFFQCYSDKRECRTVSWLKFDRKRKTFMTSLSATFSSCQHNTHWWLGRECSVSPRAVNHSMLCSVLYSKLQTLLILYLFRRECGQSRNGGISCGQWIML